MCVLFASYLQRLVPTGVVLSALLSAPKGLQLDKIREFEHIQLLGREEDG